MYILFCLRFNKPYRTPGCQPRILGFLCSSHFKLKVLPIISAIWLLPECRVYGSWPMSGEIDIVEIIGENFFSKNTPDTA